MFPFFARELLVSLRDSRRFAGLGLLVVLGAVVTTAVWAMIVHGGGEIQTWKIGRFIFIGMAFVQLLVGGSTGYWAARLVAGERENETWDLLISTPVRPVRLIMEKAGSQVLVLLLMLAGLIPCLSLCFLLGGISPNEVIGTYATIGAFTVMATAMGVTCSAWARTEVTAMRLYTLFALFYMVLFPILIAVTVEFFVIDLIRDLAPWVSRGAVENDMLHLIQTSPIVSLGTLFIMGAMPTGAGRDSLTGLAYITDQGWVMHLILSAMLLIVLATITYARLRWSWVELGGTRANGRRVKQTDSWMGSAFSDARNLILQREILTAKRSRFGSLWVSALLCFGAAGFLAFLFHEIFQGSPRESWHFITYPVFIFGSILCVTATPGAIAGERARNTWDMLSATLLCPTTILRGKLYAAMRSSAERVFLFTVVLVCLGLVVSELSGHRNSGRMWSQRPSLVVFGVLMLGVWGIQLASGLFFSVRARSPMLAQLKTVGAGVAHAGGALLFLGGIVLLAFLSNPSREPPWLESAAKSICFFSPLALMADIDSDFGAWSNRGMILQLCHGVLAMGVAVMFLLAAAARMAVATPGKSVAHKVTGNAGGAVPMIRDVSSPGGEPEPLPSRSGK